MKIAISAALAALLLAAPALARDTGGGGAAGPGSLSWRNDISYDGPRSRPMPGKPSRSMYQRQSDYRAALDAYNRAARAWESRGGRSSPGQSYYDMDGDLRCCR